MYMFSYVIYRYRYIIGSYIYIGLISNPDNP